MILSGRLENTQTLVLTQSMQQSLGILSMSIEELRRQIGELSMTNPFIEIDEAAASFASAPEKKRIFEYRELTDWREDKGEKDEMLGNIAETPESYTDYLNLLSLSYRQ